MLYLLILLIGGFLSYFGPWWVIAPVCFVLCCWRSRNPTRAFWVSALAGVTLWLGYSVYLHFVAGPDLAAQVAGIFTAGVPALASIPGIALVLLIAAVVVALVAGFSGLAGAQMKRLIRLSRG